MCAGAASTHALNWEPARPAGLGGDEQARRLRTIGNRRHSLLQASSSRKSACGTADSLYHYAFIQVFVQPCFGNSLLQNRNHATLFKERRRPCELISDCMTV